MQEVEFHTGVGDRIGFACRLLRKAYRQGARVLVTAPRDTLAELDRALWTFEERDFIPHVRVPGSAAAVAARTPIWLSPQAGGGDGEPRVVLNLGADAPTDLGTVDRLIEVVGSEPEDWKAGATAGAHTRPRAWRSSTMGAALPAPDDRPPPSADRVPTLTEVVELAPEQLAVQTAPEHAGAAEEVVPVVEATLVLDGHTEADGFTGIDPHPVQPVQPVQTEDASPALLGEASTALATEPESEQLLQSTSEASPAMPMRLEPAPIPTPVGAPDVESLVCAVLGELAPRIDRVLEARLREALAPAVARAADGLIREARQEVASALSDMVHEAVARAMRRHDAG